MKWIAIALGLLAGAAFAFGMWGLSTDAGRRVYDEMDGMIPLASLALSAPLALGAIGLGLWTWLR